MRTYALSALFLCASLPAQTLATQYRAAAGKILAAARQDTGGYAKLTYLCDRIGHRLSGSAALERAVAWSAEQMRQEGFSNVVTPAVMVPHWVRGQESAAVVAPVQRPLAMLGIGNSVGTRPEGITAEVIAVPDFETLERLGAAKVKGKIVLFNVPYRGYGQTVPYRTQSASRAADLGAVAVLVRSVASATLRTPHTGTLTYNLASPQIPAAAISIEDALFLQRLIDSGEKVQVKLNMEAKTLPDAKSANVIGEIPGREKPAEVVVLGGHLDSWDVGQGAQDDGSGCMAALQAVALIKKLGLQPRRTIRVVLWTNEENGTRGGRAYREWLGDKVKNHIAAIEMDGGAEKVVGFGVSAKNPTAVAMAKELAPLLEPIGAGTITEPGGGADIGPIMAAGVPGFGLRTVGTRYFDWHHTEADTLDKVNPDDFRQAIGALAVLSYVLADMETPLPK